MEQKTVRKTRIAFMVLLLHLAYFLFIGIFYLTSWVGRVFDYDIIHQLFGIWATSFLLFLTPLYVTQINIVSWVFQIQGLRKHEPKAKLFIMMAISILYEIAIVTLFILWRMQVIQFS